MAGEHHYVKSQRHPVLEAGYKVRLFELKEGERLAAAMGDEDCGDDERRLPEIRAWISHYRCIASVSGTCLA